MFADKTMTRQPTQGNMSYLDKGIRYGLATLLVGQVFFMSGPMQWQAYSVYSGVFVAVTAITGWDPLYALWRKLRGGNHKTSVKTEQGRISIVKAPDAANHSRIGPHKVA